MKRRYREIYDDDLLHDGQRLRACQCLQRTVCSAVRLHTSRACTTALVTAAMHRPGFRVTDYEHGLTAAWRHDPRNEGAVPDALEKSGNDAMPVSDIETAYRLYCEEISQAWQTP
jgi:hypothetical protein